MKKFYISGLTDSFCSRIGFGLISACKIRNYEHRILRLCLSRIVFVNEKPVFFVFFQDFCLQRLISCYNYKVVLEGKQPP